MAAREIIFRGKDIKTNKWVYGGYYSQNNGACFEHENRTRHYIGVYKFMDWNLTYTEWHEVHSDSIGQYTGMTEFVVSDKSYCRKLYEGDIVQIRSRRRPVGENITLYRDNTTSQYDAFCDVRAVIVFKNGEWALDYDNEHNYALEQLRGNEQVERTVKSSPRLYSFGFHGSYEQEEFRRYTYVEYNGDRRSTSDIILLGNIFDNPELLKKGGW